jgi:hypothetical protein
VRVRVPRRGDDDRAVPALRRRASVVSAAHRRAALPAALALLALAWAAPSAEAAATWLEPQTA